MNSNCTIIGGHDGKAATVRGQKGLHADTASNEMNVVPIGAETLGLKVNPAAGKLKEAATHPIASPRQAQRLIGLRSGELT
jgi:hypothetical protein